MLKIKLSKKQLGFLILILSICFGVLALIISKHITNLSNFGYLGVLIANLIGSATIFFPTPSFVATIAAGAFLSPILVAVFSAVGSTIGELTGFFAGRGGSELIQKDKRYIKVRKWMDKYGLWVIFVLAFIPNPLFDIAGALAGASKTPIWKYLTVVFPGKMFKFILLAYTGFGLFGGFKFGI
jgi:uncharacterized membrane protein YdjX (TVP38/TMEM64 family)